VPNPQQNFVKICSKFLSNAADKYRLTPKYLSSPLRFWRASCRC